MIVGVLFGAIFLENTDTFTFYIAISIINLIASLFFLLLRPVKKVKVKAGRMIVYKFKQDVRDTFKLVFTRRMSALYFLIL